MVKENYFSFTLAFGRGGGGKGRARLALSPSTCSTKIDIMLALKWEQKNLAPSLPTLKKQSNASTYSLSTSNTELGRYFFNIIMGGILKTVDW